MDMPLETDIDDFPEEEDLIAANEPINSLISSELACLALPVTVLETDLDLAPGLDLVPDHLGSSLDLAPNLLGSSSDLAPNLLGSSSDLAPNLLGSSLDLAPNLLGSSLDLAPNLLGSSLDLAPEPLGSSLGEERPESRGSLEELFPQRCEGEWRGTYKSDSLDRRSGASSSCSSYYSTSTAKALLLTQMKEVTERREREETKELMYKKQLMESLRKKLSVLREAQRGLQDDIRANAQLGDEVEALVLCVCKPNEVGKFRMLIGDLDKVVSLLLSLSGRLLRVETTLETLDPDHEEKLPLQEKKRQLLRQLSEAQDLKEHVDRREQAVSRVLGRSLTPEQHRDYSHFVKMKAALLVEQKQLEDKIRLGEEQLRGLRESLGLGMGTGLGLAMGYGQF